MAEPSDYQRNADYGYQLGRELMARAAAETDVLHQRRLLRDAEANLGWARVNDQLEQARRIVDAIDIDTIDTESATDNADHTHDDADRRSDEAGDDDLDGRSP